MPRQAVLFKSIKLIELSNGLDIPKSLYSTDGGENVTVQFENESNRDLKLSWITQQGKIRDLDTPTILKHGSVTSGLFC